MNYLLEPDDIRNGSKADLTARTSALPLKADSEQAPHHFRFVPITEVNAFIRSPRRSAK
jgi:hypothetical protein